MNTLELLLATVGTNRRLAGIEARLGPDHPEIAVILTNLGNEIAGSDPDDPRGSLTRPLYVRALEILERACGQYDPALVPVLLNLGAVECLAEQWRAAEFTYVRAVEVGARCGGIDDPGVADALRGIAYARANDLERHEEPVGAVRLYEAELALLEGALGPDHPFVIETWEELGLVGLVAVDEQDFSARGDDLDGVDDDTADRGDPHDEEPLPLHWSGATADLLRGVQMFERSLAAKVRVYGPVSGEVADALDSLSDMYRGLGDVERADALCAQAQAIDAPAGGRDWEDGPRPFLTDVSVEMLRPVDASWSTPLRGRDAASPNRRLVLGLLPRPLAWAAGLSRRRRLEDQQSAEAFVAEHVRAMDVPGFVRHPQRRAAWDPMESATVGSLIICAILFLMGIGIYFIPGTDAECEPFGQYVRWCASGCAAMFPFFWLIIYIDQPRGRRNW